MKSNILDEEQNTLQKNILKKIQIKIKLTKKVNCIMTHVTKSSTYYNTAIKHS